MEIEDFGLEDKYSTVCVLSNDDIKYPVIITEKPEALEHIWVVLYLNLLDGPLIICPRLY